MLDTKLIESALALTGKTMEDMEEVVTGPEFIDEKGWIDWNYESAFSIEKFCYYLLSPEFIEKYNTKYCDAINCNNLYTAMSFGHAIYEYQLGNEEPLTNLLSKI